MPLELGRDSAARAELHDELLKVGQLSEAFGQQTEEQLVHKPRTDTDASTDRDNKSYCWVQLLTLRERLQVPAF